MALAWVPVARLLVVARLARAPRVLLRALALAAATLATAAVAMRRRARSRGFWLVEVRFHCPCLHVYTGIRDCGGRAQGMAGLRVRGARSCADGGAFGLVGWRCGGYPRRVGRVVARPRACCSGRLPRRWRWLP